ncbi:alpha/beta hydrolase [Actimicrobium antarcticum]|uniref:Alpha/beta hydrolase n=1 Tax=Actimicrobium antarcticum TaxID=1051899 RepID=A0ABP7U0Z1_9BURK
MTTTAAHPPEFYDVQYNARAGIPDHPQLFARWAAASAQVRATAPALLDMAYGPAAGEQLDFFSCGKADAPLLVFIHGGWWRSLDKSDFSFLVPGFTSAGINVALTNYTLAPEASLEEITLQQTRALSWLYLHSGAGLFDRDRIVIAGHSAGAHLSAMLMTTLWPQVDARLPPNLIKAGILLSGLYDLAPVEHASFVNVDLKLTPARIDRLSPARLPQSHSIPFFTAVGALESDEFKRQNALIGTVWPDTHTGDIALPACNHLTICDAFATPGHPLFETAVTLASIAR